MNISVTFHGLCAFAKRADGYNALLHPESGQHKPVLTIPVTQFRISDTTWQPQGVGHDQAGNEIAMWDLTGVTIQMGDRPAPTVWTNSNGGFNLGIYHPGATPKADADVDKVIFPAGAKVSLAGGTLTFDQTRPLKLIVKKNAKEIVTADFSSAVRWQGSAASELVGTRGGDKQVIVLKNVGAIDFRITNVSRQEAPKGLDHFFRYYDLFDIQNGDYQLTLDSATADVDVYDCVPPGEIPRP